MCRKRNEELLSFGSDPVITPWYRFQGKAAVMCIGEYTREFTPHIWVYLSIHSFYRAMNPDFIPILRVGHTGGKKGQQELDRKEPPLWECERDKGRNKHKPAQGTFIILLWAKEPRA